MGPLTIHDLREKLQPLLDQDFNSLWEEHQLDTGNARLEPFLQQLQSWDLVPAEVITPLLEQLAQAAQRTPRGGSREAFRKGTDGSITQTDIHNTPAPTQRRKAPAEQRYQILGLVGEGAMGRVHLAKDLVLNRKVAVKELSEDTSSNPALAGKFDAEVQVTAQLDHPSIVPVYDLSTPTSYTMKLVEGSTLEDHINEVKAAYEEKKPLPKLLSLDQRLEVLLRVCEAMSYAHSRGVIHRDLKPENIMIGTFSQVFVMDWGIFRVYSEKVEYPVDIGEVQDENDIIIGTPGYMSPEQARGSNSKLDHRSDQYSLGLILQELVTLRPAVSGATSIEKLTRHQEGETDPLVHQYKKHIPRELAGIIAKATSGVRRNRYPSLVEFAEDIRRFRRNEPVRAAPEGLLRKLQRLMAKYQSLTLATAAVVVLMVGLAAVMIVGVMQVKAAQAQDRQQRLGLLVANTARQAAAIEADLLKLDGLAYGIATSTVSALQIPVDPTEKVYSPKDYRHKNTAPPDATTSRSRKYGPGLVSPSHGVHRHFGADNEDELRTLVRLEPHLQRALLRSVSEKRAALSGAGMIRRALLEVPTPATWASVILNNGAFIGFPGHREWPLAVDPREAEYYSSATKSGAPIWNGPRNHETGLKPVMTVSQAVIGNNDTLGVASIDVPLEIIIEKWLASPSIDATAYLVNSQAEVLAATDWKLEDLKAEPGSPFELSVFPIEEVVPHIQEGRSGNLTTEDGRLVVYDRMRRNEWHYIVVGDADALLSQ